MWRPSTRSGLRRQLTASIAGCAFAIALTVTPALGQSPGPVPLQVVILGDSYAAGNGAEADPKSYYGPHNDPDHTCYRSHDNWAERYLRALPYNFRVVNRACSGSQTTHIVNKREEDLPPFTDVLLPGQYPSTSDPRIPEDLKARGYCATDFPDEEHFVMSITSLDPDPFGGSRVDFTCRWTLDPQIEVVGENTDLVLMTTGGNDVGFGSIVRRCFLASPFRNERDLGLCRGLTDPVTGSAHQHIAAGTLEGNLETLFARLRSEMRPEARVVLVQYPHVVADSPAYVYQGYPISQYVRQLGIEGDGAQRRAVADAGQGRVIYFDKTKDCFAAREPAGEWDWVNPQRWIWELERGMLHWFEAGEGDGFLPLPEGTERDSYHANLLGHAGWAQCILDFAQPDDTFGVSGTVGGGDVDLVFAIDTTGSMGDDIDAVKAFASDLVNMLSTQTASFRFALVTYRDWPEHTGDPSDYPSRTDLDFTDDSGAIVSAINAIQVDGGGDTPETVYSGLLEALSLDWRPGVKKIVLQLGDAPPQDPESVTGFTADTVVQTAEAVDPAQVYVVNVSAGSAPAELVDIATRTGGDVFSAPTPSEVAQAVSDAIQEALAKPLAWAGGPYVVTTGTAVTLDASGSVDSDGTIVRYEWDLDGDGDFDTSSTSPTHSHAFTSQFHGTIAVRVTDDEGLNSVGTAFVDASADGDGVLPGVDNCPNAANFGQDDWDGDGIGDACDSSPVGQQTQPTLAVAAGQFHTLAVRSNGTGGPSTNSVWAWGRGDLGQLGNGATSNSSLPVQVSNLTGATAVSAGEGHSLALKSDGTVWAWGYGFFGQLGNGATSNSPVPVRVSDLTGATAVAAGDHHSLALKSDGTVRAWGNGGDGRLGNKKMTNSSVPVQVSNLTGVTAVAAGRVHSLALKSDGTVWAWGNGASGQLGNGRTSSSSAPVRVSNLTGVTAIAAGSDHNLAVKSDGTVWAWGGGVHGQLGNGGTTNVSAPVKVSNLTGVSAITANGKASYALKSDGTVWAWGGGGNGQLGNGATSNSSVPVQVSNLTGVSAVAAGQEANHVLALRSGTAWAWGSNNFGQLGSGTTSDSSIPVQVSG